LTTATEQELNEFTNECDLATFGLNNADVLDESYRKARKLDKVHFACNFNPERSGLIDAVLNTLLEGQDEDKEVEVELYKLNVYGEYPKKQWLLYPSFSRKRPGVVFQTSQRHTTG
jgi:hypothetical protein